jgi:hypothetical protein
MKKLVFSLAFFALSTLCLHAQFALGVGGGVNLSKALVDGWEEAGADQLVGFYISAQPRYVFARRWSAVMDLQYSRKGSFLTANGEETGFRMDYIDIIPQIEHRIFEHVGLAVGSNFGFKVQEQVKLSDTDWEKPVTKLDIFKNFDFGLHFALRGYWKGFYANVGYNLGLTNAVDFTLTNAEGNDIEAEWFNSTIQLGLGYLIPVRTEK